MTTSPTQSLQLQRFVSDAFHAMRQLLAKQLVMARNAKARMYEGKAQLHSVQMQLANQLSESSK